MSLMGNQPVQCGVCGGVLNPTHQMQNACRCGARQSLQQQVQMGPWPQIAIDGAEYRLTSILREIDRKLDLLLAAPQRDSSK